MKLSEKISKIITFRSQELYFLLQFVRDFHAYINQLGTHFIPDKVPNNTKTEFAEYVGELAEFWEEVLSEMEGSTPTKGKRRWEFKPQKEYSEEVQKYLLPLIKEGVKFAKYSGFLYNMVVTHAIAIFESFLSDFLIAIFILRPKTLKSENTATYEYILSFSSRKELIGNLAINRAEKILEGDLYCDVADKLNKAFSINISKFNKFNIIHEAFCRRHIIVHNDGKTDKEYCLKIPNSRIGEYLSTDLKYVETLLITMGQFIDYLDGCFSRKMHYRRESTVNQLLNPPDSMEGSKDNS